MSSDEYFYTELPIHKLNLTELLSSKTHFKTVPKDWYIVVIDIESSTQAVKHKLHHPVNYAASISIVAILNELQSIDPKIEIPYFFGGDGTTFLVPHSCVQRLMLILENVKDDVYKNNFLTLRVGTIQIAELNKVEPASLQISKLQLTDTLIVPIVTGNGLQNAEKIIKKKLTNDVSEARQNMYVTTKGCKCRWDRIAPVEASNKVLCFIANITDDAKNLEVLHAISKTLDTIFGNYTKRLPLQFEALKNYDAIQDIHEELSDVFDDSSMLDALILNVSSISNSIYNSTDMGKAFIAEFRASALAMLIDGAYSDIITGSKQQIEEFIKFMDALEVSGAITYGYHVTDSTVLSCYVAAPKGGFVQLLDGNEGGYSTAAKMLKVKSKIID